MATISLTSRRNLMIRRLLAAVTVALVLAGLPAAPAVATEPAPIVAVTLNVHGSTDRHGNGNGGRPEEVVRDLLAVVRTQNPDVIGVQEVCHRQHRVIRAELRKLGYRATMTYARASAGCNDRAKGNRFGNALYVKAPKLTWRKSYALPDPINPEGTTGREPRRLVCAAAVIKGASWTACTTHIGPHDPDLSRQTGFVSNVLTGRPGNVIALGDWNAKTPKVSLPNRAGAGIDHAFSTHPLRLAGVLAVPSSDHKAVTVTTERNPS